MKRVGRNGVGGAPHYASSVVIANLLLDFVIEYLARKGVLLDAKSDHNQTALQLADEQELFRFMHDKEGPHGFGLEGENAGKVIVRETQTTNAFKRTMGLKTNVASN